MSVYQALTKLGLSSGQIAHQLKCSNGQVRRLGSDGDEGGWAPRSLKFYQGLDLLTRTKCPSQPELAPLRAAFDQACDEFKAAELRLRSAGVDEDGAQARRAGYAEELTAYLRALKGFLGETHTWIPHNDLGEAFQKRAVRVSSDPPCSPDDEALYVSRATLSRGNVSWTGAMRDVPVAVVVADAGYGKTWLLREHGRELCDRASEALAAGVDPADVEIPLWMHAGDLARGWSSEGSPADALVRAGMRAARNCGFTASSRLVMFMAGRLAPDSAPLHVLVDAYDEVFDDDLRSSARQALSWVRTLSRRHSGPRLVLTSRGAGYTDPFRGGNGEGHAARYIEPGVLDVEQVWGLWKEWFRARGEPIPVARLEAVLAPASPMRGFARIPLIAAFCAWVAEIDTVATNRTGLYEQVVRRFLAQSWKEHGAAQQDGGLRAALDKALTELAWTMATGIPVWRDAIDIAECESELARAGLQPSRDHSRSWLAVREIGVLVQAAAQRSEPLGDSPVLWIHRSVHEFLVARKLVTLPADYLTELLGHRAWMQPEWGEVIHFAIGLETVAGGTRPVTEVLRSLALDGRDGLGWFATAFASAGAGMPPDSTARRAIVERIWTLQHAGFVTPVRLANVLALVPEGSPEEIAKILLDSPPTLEKWEALAWCGEPGRSALTEAIESAAGTHGAAAALYKVDPEAAVAAVRRRLANLLPVSCDDATVLRALENTDVVRLAELYTDQPDAVHWAENLGWTKHPMARQVLLDPALLQDPNPAVRQAALAGIWAYADNDLDTEVFEIISTVALAHEDRTMRIHARECLRIVALSVPWVEEAIAHDLPSLFDDATEPELVTLDTLAARLRTVGPATLKTVVMLVEEPRLIQGPVPEALAELTAKVLRGELDVEISHYVAVIERAEFAQAACAWLSDKSLDNGANLSRLALGLLFANQGDPDIYAAVVDYTGRHPQPLLEAGLKVAGQDPLGQVEILLAALSSLGQADQAKVQVWSDVLRGLLLKVPATARRNLLPRCAAVTEHVLELTHP
ncbi:NACHT domain-containing protein [Streptomyces olivoreticuli]|uniref:NACHT domain-containing protein n=1 Tax=Streptomyces olivoreticuli TaxID=68246 RepID=UPI0013C32211|nr:hypothetical protein [Streptomyces olivoreticuli]